jgi:hypothetical protein
LQPGKFRLQPLHRGNPVQHGHAQPVEGTKSAGGDGQDFGLLGAQVAAQIVGDLLNRFGQFAYTFNKPHAWTFARVACRQCWLLITGQTKE